MIFMTVTTMLLVIALELYLRVQISENIHSGLLCHGKQLRIILKFKVQLSTTLSFKEVISSINNFFNNLPPKIWLNRLHQLWLIIFNFFFFIFISWKAFCFTSAHLISQTSFLSNFSCSPTISFPSWSVILVSRSKKVKTPLMSIMASRLKGSKNVT